MGYFEDLGKIQELQKKRTREEQANEWKRKSLTTLGIGVATALAFKGGKRLLSNSARASKLATKFTAGRAAIRNNVQSKDIFDLTYKDLRQRQNFFKRGFKAPLEKVSVHDGGNNTVAHSIADAISLRNTATQMAPIDFGIKATQDAAAETLENYKHLERNQFNHINNLMRKNRLHTIPKDEDEKFLSELEKHKLTSEQHKAMIDARSNYLQKINDETYKNQQTARAIKQQNEEARLKSGTYQLNDKWGQAKKGEVSVGDFINKPELFGNTQYAIKTAEDELGNITYQNVDLRELLQKHMQSLPEEERKMLMGMKFSNTFKYDKSGNVYSNADLRGLGYEVGDFVANSLPGKIMNVRGYMERNIGKDMDFTIGSGTLSYGLENIVGGTSTGHLKHDVKYINGKAYVANDEGQLVYNHELTTNYNIVSGRYGREANVMQAMAGNTLTKTQDNRLLRFFDFSQDKENQRQGFAAIFNKIRTQGNPDYIKNQTAYLFNTNVEDAPELYFEKADALRKYLHEHTYSQFSLADKEQLAATGNSNINKLLDIDRIQNVNQKREALHALSVELANNPDAYNPIAEDIAKTMGNNKMAYNYSGRKATDSTANITLNLRDLGDPEKTVGSNEFNNLSEKVNQLITHELKENGLLTKDLTGKLSENAQDIIAYSTIENAIKSNDSVLNKAFSVDEILNSEDYSQIGQYAQRVINKYTSYTDEVHEPTLHIMTDRENPFGFLHKTWTPVDVAKNLMKGDLQGGMNALKKNFTQFAAGRNNMQDVTAATQMGYYMLHRLNEVGEYVGLGLSSQSAYSAGGLLKGIAFKRILPAAIAYNQLEYLDDEVEDHTGLAPSAAFASGVANIDVNARRVMDTVGATDFFKKQYEINPIMRYWGDGGKFYNADELTDYYANGYTAVRNAPWWTFGGVNEARGGAIQYWSPTITRRMASDYYDKSLYGSNDNKWAHSLMPTLTHPFSTLNYLANPYWLEEMHKDDRPYPVSGKLFANGTPWGAILNPTIGEIIKPVKEMQPDRLRNGIDLKALMYAKLKAEGADDSQKSVLVTKTGGADIMRQVKYSKADRNTKLTSYNIQNGELMNVYTDIHETLDRTNGNGSLVKMYTNNKEQIQTKDYGQQVLKNNAIVTGDGTTLGIQINNPEAKINPLNWYDELKMESMASSNKGLINSFKNQIADIASNVVTKETGIDRITRIQNKAKEIDARTKSLNSMDTDDEKFDASESILVKDKLRNYSPSKSLDLINDPDQIVDLINAKKGDELVQDLAKSTRLITGIYGYMAGATLDFGSDYGQRIATSQNMESFSRKFWDENLGGFGGSTMEIIRRFIPDFRRHKMINPLMNNMPEWLPENFRFGDPYCITEDTLVEVNELNFVEAKDINKKDSLLTHVGKINNIKDIAIREVLEEEKIYQFEIASIFPISSKFSENHPILVSTVKNQYWNNKAKNDISYTKYEKLNSIIKCLEQNILSKKEISNLTNISIDWIYLYFKILYNDGIIDDYKKDKNFIIPKRIKYYETDLLKKKLKWKKAKDLKTGEYVVYPLPEYEEKEITIDLAKISNYKYTKKYVYYNSEVTQDFIECYEFLENRKNISFKRFELKEILIKNNWSRRAMEHAQDAIRNNKTPRRNNRYIILNPELMFAVGLYLAEGWSRENSKMIGYALHIKEKSLFDRSIKAFEKSGFNIISSKWRRQKETNGAQGLIQCAALTHFMDYLVGKYAHEKTLNNLFWYLSKENLLRFMEGYFTGDGHNFETTSGSYKTKTYKVGISSCNLKLLMQIRKLLLRFEIILNISEKSEQKTIINNKIINSDINYVGNVVGNQAVKLAKLLWDLDIKIPERKSPNKTYIKDGYIHMRINSIKEFTHEDYPYVYGYEMEDIKSFCTAGLATHNTSIARGEARLPGAGYEALNELHPDQFGDKYGAFDRFKILADIAPNSSEYKIWKEIAAKTVTDPKLKEEMKAIKERRAQQGKKHDFYDYQVLGKNVDYQNIIISEIMGYGRFRSGNTIYKLAGVKVKGNENETMQDVLSKYIHVGDTVTIATDSNEAYQKNKDSAQSTNAAVFINGESLSTIMEENGDAEKRKGDTTAAGLFARFGLAQRTMAGLSEVLAHADIPILSDQWLRVRDPYEAYRAEEVYGTSYQSWEHPIDTFLMPAVERAIHERSLVNTAIQRFAQSKIRKTGGSNVTPWHGLMLTNRSYLVSAAIPYVLGKHELAHKMGMLGSNFAVGAHVLTGGNNFLEQGFEGGDLGWKLAKFFGAESKYGKAAGAVAGVMFAEAIRTVRGNEEWKPERTKRRWAMEDYFDRLTYLKYKGLYEEAAKRAKDEEGFDVEKYIEESKEADDKAKKKQEYYQSLKDRLKRNSRNQPLQKAYLKLLNKQKNAVEENKVIENVGEWGRTAMLYRKAMNSTMFGLTEDSSWGEIVSALPQNDREFFMEFVKERDKNKRKKILDTVSPQLRKALQMAWKMDLDKEETNEEYFTKHKLPDATWAGWRPDVDMQGIEAKTIKNEGATLSDFGLYESALDTPSANLFGDDLQYSDYSENSSTVEKNLTYILKGQGLKDVDIKVYDGIGDKSTIEAKIDSWTKDKDMQKKIKDTLKAEELKKNPQTN